MHVCLQYRRCPYFALFIAQEEDSRIKKTIDTLVRENIEVLSSTKAKEDGEAEEWTPVVEFIVLWLSPAVQLEQDVKESILAMAKQSGKIDPDVRMAPLFISIVSLMYSLVDSPLSCLVGTYSMLTYSPHIHTHTH